MRSIFKLNFMLDENVGSSAASTNSCSSYVDVPMAVVSLMMENYTSLIVPRQILTRPSIVSQLMLYAEMYIYTYEQYRNEELMLIFNDNNVKCNIIC